MLEEELLKSIKEADTEIKEFRIKVTQHRDLMLQYETELIAQKMRKASLEEELRVLLLKKVSPDIDEYDLEIENFRKKYPELVAWANSGRKPDSDER